MKRLIALIGILVLTVSAFGATSSQTRLYGYVVLFGDSLANAKVTLTLEGKNYFYTSGQTICAGKMVTYTNSVGYFAFDTVSAVWGVDSLFPSDNATYSISIEQPKLQSGGLVFQVSGLTINADGDSTDIRDVLAQ